MSWAVNYRLDRQSNAVYELYLPVRFFNTRHNKTPFVWGPSGHGWNPNDIWMCISQSFETPLGNFPGYFVLQNYGKLKVEFPWIYAFSILVLFKPKWCRQVPVKLLKFLHLFLDYQCIRGTNLELFSVYT